MVPIHRLHLSTSLSCVILKGFSLAGMCLFTCLLFTCMGCEEISSMYVSVSTSDFCVVGMYPTAKVSTSWPTTSSGPTHRKVASEGMQPLGRKKNPNPLRFCTFVAAKKHIKLLQYLSGNKNMYVALIHYTSKVSMFLLKRKTHFRSLRHVFISSTKSLGEQLCFSTWCPKPISGEA